MKEKWKIIAIGNPLKEDDAIALKVAEKINNPKIIKAENVPENFIKKGDSILLIDSVYFSAKPGAVKLFSGKEVEDHYATSHNLTPLIFSLAKEIKVIGIQPYSSGLKESLSPELEAKLEEIAEKVRKIVKQFI